MYKTKLPVVCKEKHVGKKTIYSYTRTLIGQKNFSNLRLTDKTFFFWLTPWTNGNQCDFSWKVYLGKFCLLVCTAKNWQFFLAKEPCSKASHANFWTRKICSCVYGLQGKLDKCIRNTSMVLVNKGGSEINVG
jgi:hypothetical protein